MLQQLQLWAWVLCPRFVGLWAPRPLGRCALPAAGSALGPRAPLAGLSWEAPSPSPLKLSASSVPICTKATALILALLLAVPLVVKEEGGCSPAMRALSGSSAGSQSLSALGEGTISTPGEGQPGVATEVASRLTIVPGIQASGEVAHRAGAHGDSKR